MGIQMMDRVSVTMTTTQGLAPRLFSHTVSPWKMSLYKPHYRMYHRVQASSDEVHGSLSFWSTQHQQPNSGRSGMITFRHCSPMKDHKTIQEQIGAAGLSGIASYGLFNTLYYFFAYLAILYSLPRPADTTSLSTALPHVFKLLALVWAGSQVTKVPRAACALAFSPLMDRLLGWLRERLRLQNKRQAFLYILVPACWLLFFILIGISVVSFVVT